MRAEPGTDLKKLRDYLPLVAVGVTALVLAERLFLLVDRYAVNIFFSDQWEFNDATLFESHTWLQIFIWQHGPHRQGLGGVLAKLIDSQFAWDSRIESFVAASVFVAATALAVWLKYRLLGKLEYYDVAIPLLFLTATQCEAIFGAANFAHGSMPLLLVVTYCLAWTIRNDVARLATVLAVNFLLIYTGFGLLMGPLTPVMILACLWKSAVARQRMALYAGAIAVSALSLGSFFLHYVWNPAVSCYDSMVASHSAADYLQFAALIVANYAGFDGMSSRHPAAWGMVLLLLLAGVFVAIAAAIVRARGQVESEATPAHIVTFVLVAFTMAFCAATARGRLCLGFAAAQESRYMPYLTPGFLGAYFYLKRALPKRWLRHAMLAAFLLLCAYAGWPVHTGDQLEYIGFREQKLRWKNCYLANKNIALCNRQVGRRICNPGQDVQLQRKLDFLEQRGLNLFDGR